MLRQFFSKYLLNAVNFALIVLLIFAYFGRPLPIPIFENQRILSSTGLPVFTRMVATKSAGSGSVFTITGTTFYCGIGVTQGESSCDIFESMLDKKSRVTVRYIYMPTRLGTEYPLIHSIEQDGVQKINSRFMRDRLDSSSKSAWKYYYIILIFWGLLAAFLFVTESLKSKHAKT